MLTVATYLAYLAVAMPLTVWVAGTLARNGRVFLDDVFGGDTDLAEAVTRLLVVGFYLVNLGFVALYLRIGHEVLSVRDALEVLSVKLGVVLLLLGVVHTLNVCVLNAIRRRTRLETLRASAVRTPPWPPQHSFPQPATAPYPRPPGR